MDLVLDDPGGQGTLTVSGDAINLKTKVWPFPEQVKTLLIRNIVAVAIKKTSQYKGLIEFTTSANSWIRDVWAFHKEGYEMALRIKAYVETWAAEHRSATGEPSGASAADEIRKLKALMDEGVITAEQFDVKKKQLLGV